MTPNWGTNVIGLADALDDITDLSHRLDGTSTYVVGTSVEYAVFVEFGTSRMRAQPYFRPAIRETMAEADALSEGVDSADALVAAIAHQIERKMKENVAVDTGNLRSSIRAERIR